MTATDDSPISSIEANTEATVLAAAMRNPAELADVLITALTPAAFARPVHQQLMQLITDVCNRGDSPGLLTVSEAAQAARLGHVVEYITQLTANSVGWDATTPNEFNWHVGRLSNYAYTRAIAEHGAILQAIPVTTDPEEVARLRDRARQIIDAVPDLNDADADNLDDLARVQLERTENPAAPDLVPTPWADLNTKLGGGLQAEQLVIVAARPAMGKSVVGTELARHAAFQGLRTVLVSLEMSKEEVTARITAATAGVDLDKTMRMTKFPDVLNERDWDLIAGAHSKFEAHGKNLTIVTSPGLTVPNLDRRLTAMSRQGDPARLLVVDYLGLMQPTRRTESRQVDFAEMSRALKILAAKHGIPVVVLAQLNRGPEQRQEKTPMLADLRESGTLEQDANVVILLFREEVYEEETVRMGELDLIVAKNRNGPIGTITVSWQGHYARAKDMARHA
jgi:replicative DNA helicase